MSIQRDINFNNVNKAENDTIKVWRITKNTVVTLSYFGVDSIFKSLDSYLTCVRLRREETYFKYNKNHYSKIKISEYDTKRY